MSQKTSFQRLFVILDRLNKGETLCIKSIASEFEVSERTVYRDFELIQETWGDFMTSEGKCYKAYKKELLGDILRGTDLSLLSSAVRIVNSGKLKTNIDKKVKSLIDKSEAIYSFNTKPFEVLTNPDCVAAIEKAIFYRQKVKIKYSSRGTIVNFNVNAYKIIFMNENFYLAGEVDKDKPYILLRVSMIKDVTVLSDTFIIKPKMKLFIDSIQTPFAQYKEDSNNIKVVTAVNADILKYFEAKKYLPSQKIGKTLEDGTTIVSFDITAAQEFVDLAIKWMPKMKILSPQFVKSRVKKELLKKMEGLV